MGSDPAAEQNGGEIVELTKKEQDELEKLAKKMMIMNRGRKLLSERCTKRLLSLSTESVGLACKEFVAAAEGWPSGVTMTDEAWNAYDLLLHLVYEDWDESEVLTIGRK